MTNSRSPITTHILDTSKGCPASNVEVLLELNAQGQWKKIGKSQTNQDGRAESLLEKDFKIQPGIYRVSFESGKYFRNLGAKCFYPSVSIVFEIINTEQHYHVPLLISPFGYSTYRGS